MKINRLWIVVLLLSTLLVPGVAQAAGPRESDHASEFPEGLYDAEGEPVKCYVCGRTHDQVFDVYLAAIRVELDKERNAITDRYAQENARYQERRTDWEDMLSKAESLPDIVRRMKSSTARAEMSNLEQDYPVLPRLSAYPRGGQGPSGDATIEVLVAWIADNPPVAPDFANRDFRLALIDEQEEAIIAYLHETELIADHGVGTTDQRGSSRRNPYEIIDSISQGAKIPRATAFEVVAAMQRTRDTMGLPRNRLPATDEDLAAGMTEAEIDPELARYMTRDRFSQLTRSQIPNLNEDPEHRWREYQQTFDSFAASIPICVLCAPRR